MQKSAEVSDTPCNLSAARRERWILMRLAARAPPPPILELGVRCSWLHSAACKFSIEIRAVPGGFGDLQILLQKRVWNVSKMMPKPFKFHPKSTTIVSRSVSGRVLEADRCQDLDFGCAGQFLRSNTGVFFALQNLPEPRFN